jgi:hypothetical protein
MSAWLSTLYSRPKKAMAPSRMKPAMTRISSVPVSCFAIHLDRTKAKIKASAPAPTTA